MNACTNIINSVRGRMALFCKAHVVHVQNALKYLYMQISNEKQNQSLAE